MHPHDNAARPASQRLAIVARVSTEEQERYGTSLEDQAGKGELYSQLHGMNVVDSAPYQGDESGALPLRARPIMQRLLADARARKFDAVCFHKIDRIARRLKYMLEVWDALEEAGVTVHIIGPAVDSSHYMGRLLRNILGSIAEFEREMLLERTGAGGAVRSRPAPFTPHVASTATSTSSATACAGSRRMSPRTPSTPRSCTASSA
jgi:site-specific DNA recombinase